MMAKGVLPSQALRALIANGAISASLPITDAQIQPASLDLRLGPVLEVIVNGKYYWMPFAAIATLRCDPPQDLRDSVWTAANLTLHNGGEFVGAAVAEWLGGRGIELMAVAPASPWQNGYVESFHGKLRDEFLDRSVFADVADAAAQAAWFRREYNTVRPHSGLDYRTPQAFAATCGAAGTSTPGGTTPPTPKSA